MSKSKLSLEDSITLAQKNATDFTHACVTIALNEKFGIGKERQKKVNAVRDEVNGKVLEIMTRPASRKHEPLRKAEAWMHSQMPEGTVWELHIPMAKGRARSHKEWKMQGAVDSAATLEWRVCAIACAEVLGFGAERLNRLHEEVLANYRQLNQWVLEEGVDVAMEWFRRSCTGAYKTDVEVLDRPGTGRGGKAHPDRAAVRHTGQLAKETDEMTLTEAMQYRGLTAWKLAERTGVKTQTAKKWMEPGGTRKITVERLRQITEILDGGALITEDGVEFELYGGKV